QPASKNVVVSCHSVMLSKQKERIAILSVAADNAQQRRIGA
ncbi:MAG: hypothetical protein ACI8RN_000756, partial [Glaciecola sp.]